MIFGREKGRKKAVQKGQARGLTVLFVRRKGGGSNREGFFGGGLVGGNTGDEKRCEKGKVGREESGGP